MRCELDRETADTAGAGMNQDGLASANVQPTMQRAQSQVYQKRIRYPLCCAGPAPEEEARQGVSGKPGGTCPRIIRHQAAGPGAVVARESLSQVPTSRPAPSVRLVRCASRTRTPYGTKRNAGVSVAGKRVFRLAPYALRLLRSAVLPAPRAGGKSAPFQIRTCCGSENSVVGRAATPARACSPARCAAGLRPLRVGSGYCASTAGPASPSSLPGQASAAVASA